MTQNDLEMTFKWPWDQKQLHHCARHEKIFKSCRTFCPLTLIILLLIMQICWKGIENGQKWPKMTLKWPLMTFKWPWDQKQLHHCVRHEKIFKSCRTFCPLTLIVLDLLVKNSDFGGGGPLWATVGPKREFSQIWLVDLFFQAHKGDEKNVLLSQI